MRRLVLSSLVFLSLSARAATPIEVTEEEFKMYQHYQLAMADSRVQAMKPEARLPAIAKDAGFKVKDLQAAITRREAAGDLKATCEANLKETFAQGELAGRVTKATIDVTGPAGYLVVEFVNDDAKTIYADASYVAAKAIAACPFTSTISMLVADKTDPRRKVFSALISSGSAKRIVVEKVKDFADGRYAKLFEKVKNAANGDIFADDSVAPK